ncbi:glucose 1-dehydrogenase [Nocardia sp. NBC_00565]|uniref:SDR family NAD(P)-dependent oxidoreductase n=1 Tax=Nocardia sp. NBC_00565 TaxID=2975993 RepID=UPI002E818E8C|nr:glucose 1-dehydrogenase [Nocardia sp. NBC_00565]WUC04713.1 glucose 1-dehydrogenase [Nocardia sp. NBC_00565]
MSYTPTQDPLLDIAGKVVLITGGSRGLGRAMSLHFAERGARVVVSSRKYDACHALVQQINASGGESFARACHIGDWHELDGLINDVVAHYGRLDVLINNAGMSPSAPSLLETSETLVDKIIDVNFKGPLRLTALAATAMSATGGGSIINISSLASVRPTPIATAYSAAKAGLNALTRASAQEYAAVGVRINAIICGTFDTDAAAGFVRNPDLLPTVVAPIAMHRVGMPHEVVGAALYLASAASSYTTGSFITIDGGVAP